MKTECPCAVEIEAEQERLLLRQMLRAHERDRRLTAYEIHDGLVQHAVAARMYLESICQAEGTLGAEATDKLRQATRQLDAAILEARRLIGGLRPPVLDERGVAAAIHHLVGDQPEEGPVVLMDARLESRRFEPLLEATAYRIVQEGLTNARRHSQSDRVEVVLRESNDRLRIEIRDWGIGFDPKHVRTDCYGLRGMRERAELLHGWLEVKSTSGEGTRIIVELPILASRS
ncbi:MAG: sensor histidine kinase [Pirellulales bacterium]|nr:sensor histidine kinase [Pirellulales bacterium]